MSLIIKGMSLPRKSEHRECSIAVVQNRPVSIAFSRTKTNPFECFECAEIPTPHGRLIDADRLLAVLKSMASTSEHVPVVAILDLIDHQPFVVEAEKGDENV